MSEWEAFGLAVLELTLSLSQLSSESSNLSKMKKKKKKKKKKKRRRGLKPTGLQISLPRISKTRASRGAQKEAT